MSQVYISIGNSDNKLTQEEWAAFCTDMDKELEEWHMLGRWFSLPNSPYQNACWAIDVPAPAVSSPYLQAVCKRLARKYKQDSVAWAECPETVFLGPYYDD